eukprot:394738-Amphidinium_carterae.1
MVLWCMSWRVFRLQLVSGRSGCVAWCRCTRPCIAEARKLGSCGTILAFRCAPSTPAAKRQQVHPPQIVPTWRCPHPTDQF